MMFDTESISQETRQQLNDGPQISSTSKQRNRHPQISSTSQQRNSQPHIIYFLADDLGWNDVGYHGSFVKTPTIDRLAAEGVKLEKFYVQPFCTPSRASMLSGRYIMHTGLQHLHIQPRQPNALTLNSTLLPEVLRHYGYKNYLVGKWHLGFYTKEYLPHNRGFDKHFGIYPGQATHYDRTVYGKYCLVENGKPYQETTTYSTHLYVQKTTEYVEQHLTEYPDKPMFLFVSWQAVHIPNQVPKHYIKLYDNSKQGNDRKAHAAMATAMDEGIKNITDLFIRHGLWNNTVMLFSTDNGGHTTYGASNHPLRGQKGTLYEGGIRGVAFARGKGIKPGRVSNSLMHMTDIYPTIVALAQQNIKQREDPLKDYFKTLDGHDVWSTIAKDTQSPRHELLVNIDPVTPVRGPSLYPDLYNTGIRSAIIHGPWKLITGYCKRPYDQPHDPPVIDPRIQKILNVQLFNIETDPEENNNLFFNNTEVVKMLLKRLEYYSRDAVKAYYPRESSNWNPSRLKGVVLPWIDNPSFFV